MRPDDTVSAAAIHSQSFPRQTLSLDWIDSNLRSFPKVMAFVAESSDGLAGYILWAQKSGFRPEVVLELEQVAVHPDFRKRGVAQTLIESSLPLVRSELTHRAATIKHIIVTTRADNFAQELYRKALGAEVEATIRNLYSADEVLMVCRNPRT